MRAGGAGATTRNPKAPAMRCFTCILRGSEQAKKRGAEALAANPAEEDQSVLLEIGRETGELARIVVRDKGGVGVEFRFAQWRDDPVIAEALFHFEVPRGVAIVNGELPGEQSNAQ